MYMFLLVIILALLPTCLTDDWWWEDKIKHRSMTKSSRFGIKYQIAIFVITLVVILVGIHFLERFLFPVLRINALFLGCVTYVAVKLHDAIVQRRKQSMIGRIIHISIFVLLIIVIFFDYNNYSKTGQMGSITSSDEADFNINDEKMRNFKCNQRELQGILNSNFTKQYWMTDGCIEYSDDGILVIDMKNERLEFIECENADRVPAELRQKNSYCKGIQRSEKGTLYFIYSLMDSNTFLGGYYEKEYALYNPITGKVKYYKENSEWMSELYSQ